MTICMVHSSSDLAVSTACAVLIIITDTLLIIFMTCRKLFSNFAMPVIQDANVIQSFFTHMDSQLSSYYYEENLLCRIIRNNTDLANFTDRQNKKSEIIVTHST